MIKIAHIVAVDSQFCIGKDNALAWHLPEDWAYFKQMTQNSIIVMGRKTFDSLGRLLPKRTHHIISRDKSYTVAGASVWSDMDSAIKAAKADAITQGQTHIFIIGGGEIYRQSMSMADTLYITHVALDVQGDAFYPPIADNFTQTWCSDIHTDNKTGTRFYFAKYEKQV